MAFIDQFGVVMAACLINQIFCYLYIYSMTAIPQIYIASKKQRLRALSVIVIFYILGENIENMVMYKVTSDETDLNDLAIAVSVISVISSIGLIFNRPNRDEKSNSQVYYENNPFNFE